MVDAAGSTEYTYTASSQVQVERGPWASDNVTNSQHRMPYPFLPWILLLLSALLAAATMALLDWLA